MPTHESPPGLVPSASRGNDADGDVMPLPLPVSESTWLFSEEPATPLLVEHWMADEASGTQRRESVLAEQAAAQKAREQQRDQVRRALYRFLLGDAD